MIRGLADAVALFALPFLLYGVALVAQRRFRLLGPQWSQGRLALLSIAGLGLVVVALLVYGALAPRPKGAYVPAHLDKGQIVPGEIR